MTGPARRRASCRNLILVTWPFTFPNHNDQLLLARSHPTPATQPSRARRRLRTSWTTARQGTGNTGGKERGLSLPLPAGSPVFRVHGHQSRENAGRDKNREVRHGDSGLGAREYETHAV